MNNLFEVKLKEAETEKLFYKNKIAYLENQLPQSEDNTEGQTDSEKIWERAWNHRAYNPHISNSTTQGPQSLPLELISEAQREVRRLQELRRYIQEECDHLLLRKERLKEEVVWHAGFSYSYHGPLPSAFCLHPNDEKTDVWDTKSRKLDQNVVCMQNNTTSL